MKIYVFLFQIDFSPTILLKFNLVVSLS